MLPSYKGFKKVSDDKDKSVLAHENGHKITIVKKGLSKKLQKDLEALPIHQAEGSEEPIEAPEEEVPGATGPAMGASSSIGAAQEPEAPPSNIMSSTMGGTPEAPANAAPQPTQEQEDPNASIKMVPGGEEKLAGIEGASKALQTQADTMAGLQKNWAVAQEKAANDLKAQLAETINTRDMVTRDIMSNHIRPNAYLQDMGVGGKIATAIGLFLGGIGSAKTGQPNPALQFLNDQINRNLEAQKVEMGNKHNLLSALEKQYGDKLTAANMFRAIDANVTASKMEQAAMTSQSAQAKANALMGVGALKEQSAMYLRQANLAGLRAGVQQSGPGLDMDAKAQHYLQAARTLDPAGAKEFEARYIPGVGVSRVPLETSDRKELESRSRLQALYNDAERFMAETNNHGLGPIPGLQAARHAEGKSLQSQLTLHGNDLTDFKRLTPLEWKIFQEGTPDLTGTHFTGKDAAKLKVLRQANENALRTFFTQKGIPHK